MKVCEYGSEHEKTVAMFQCAAEPGWVFIPSAEALAKDYHVFLFIADGHDESGTTFVSIEKYVDDAASYGCVAERGSHETLMAAGGLYHTMVTKRSEIRGFTH